MFFLIFLIAFVWILFCLFSGNYINILGIPVVFAVYYINEMGIDRLFPLMLVPFIFLLVIDIFVWREQFLKPKFWRRIEYIPSISIVIFLIAYYFIFEPDFYTEKTEDMLGFILVSIFMLAGAFGMTKMFITDLFYFLINRLKTFERYVVTKQIDKVKTAYESKTVIYYIHLQGGERVRVNLLCVLYLHFFAKNKTVEFTFKRGLLGLEYCDRLPKIIN